MSNRLYDIGVLLGVALWMGVGYGLSWYTAWPVAVMFFGLIAWLFWRRR